MYERSRNILDCYIAGFTYYNGLDVINQLAIGTVLTLWAEPENPHDPEAVAVYFGATKLGYIPRNENSVLSQLLYFGHANIIEARISSRNLEALPEKQFRIVVKLKDGRLIA